MRIALLSLLLLGLSATGCAGKCGAMAGSQCAGGDKGCCASCKDCKNCGDCKEKGCEDCKCEGCADKGGAGSCSEKKMDKEAASCPMHDKKM